MSDNASTGAGADKEDRAHSLEDDDDNSQSGDASHRRKRQRVRLSCLECRRRKLSCSRDLPCDRCIKSGTPERCTYETRPGAGGVPSATGAGHPGSAAAVGARPFPADLQRGGARREADVSILRDAVKDHDRIRRLELEVAQLRGVLAKQASIDGTTVGGTPSTVKGGIPKDSPLDIPLPTFCQTGAKAGDGLEFKFVRGHNFKTRFFGPHNAWSSFKELTGLTPFMRETAEEWLRPLNIARKDRPKRLAEREKNFHAPDLELEALLPTKDEVDSLVAAYLDQFEQLNRIVHVPTFQRDYDKFWGPSKTRPSAFTALLLAMLATSSCLDMQQSSKYVGVKSNAHQTAERWTLACDAWLDRQSQKHRRMIHYQIMCMLYLAKRVNVIKKKRFWTNSGSILRDGIVCGLHQDGEQFASRVSPYYCEMRRRIWATMMEFDVQASFDQGVPTLLSQLTVGAKAPRNIDDEEFDEDTEELPSPKSTAEYTFSSYQNLSRQSLQTRLELNRVMTGPAVDLDWERVTRYTEMVMQEIDALPPWDAEDLSASPSEAKKPLLAFTLLHIQLRQYLIPLHQPYLKLRQHNSKYTSSEFLYYTAARDMVLMQDRLYQNGIRTLYFLREDTMSAAMSLCSVSLHQPRGSLSLVSSNADETLKLIEKCITIKEDRILRCGNNDPWGYSSMCAALGLLETHLGKKTFEAAKASAAERFISLHYKLLAYQIPPFAQTSRFPATTDTETPQSQLPADKAKSSAAAFAPSPANSAMPAGSSPFHRDGLSLSMPWIMPQTDPTQAQTMVPNPDFNLELLGMDLNDLWANSEWPNEFL